MCRMNQFLWAGLFLLATTAVAGNPQVHHREHRPLSHHLLNIVTPEDQEADSVIEETEIVAGLERAGPLKVLAKRCFETPAGGSKDLRTGYSWHFGYQDPIVELRGLKFFLPENSWPAGVETAPCVSVVEKIPAALLPTDNGFVESVASFIFVFSPLKLQLKYPVLLTLPFDVANNPEDLLLPSRTLQPRLLPAGLASWVPLDPPDFNDEVIDFGAGVASCMLSQLGSVAWFRVQGQQLITAGSGQAFDQSAIAGIVAASVILSACTIMAFYYLVFIRSEELTAKKERKEALLQPSSLHNVGVQAPAQPPGAST